MQTKPTHQIYAIEVDVTVRRKEGRYDSTNIAKVSINEEVPLVDDYDAINATRNRVLDILDKATGTMEARIHFEDHVKRLTEGDVVEEVED